MKKIFYKNIYIFIIIIISIFVNSNQMKTTDFNCKNSITLLDQTNAALCSNGIHFFDKNFEYEEINKAINFTYSDTNKNKIGIFQFSNEDNGYILFFVDFILYIFDNNKNNLNSQEITQEDLLNTNIQMFNFIPYKKDNNYLKFILSCSSPGSDYITLFTFIINLGDNYSLDINKKSIKIDENNYVGVANAGISCIFMSPLSSLNINNKLLTCFFGISVWDKRVYSITFDPEHDYREITGLRSFTVHNDMTYDISYISGITNDGEKALIYIIFEYFPFWVTFDYNNLFSSIVRESLGNHQHLAPEYYKYKFVYFQETQEFVMISAFSVKNDGSGGGCDKFVMVFNNNCEINYKGILYHSSNEQCGYINSLIIYHDEKNYTVMSDAHNTIFFQQSVEEIQDIYSSQENNTATTIITTYPETKIPTTIITTIPETDSPTTITTTEINIPTSIITTIPEIPTSIITTIITTIPEIPTSIVTTIITTIPEIPTSIITTIISTIPEIPTPIITTIITTIPIIPTTIIPTKTFISTTYNEIYNPSTIITTNIETSIILTTYIDKNIITTIATIYNDFDSTEGIKENYSGKIKCKTSTPESAVYDLCIECNIDQQYFPAFFPENDFLHGFTECYNSITKPINFYFDNTDNHYKPCFETCLTCNEGGNGENNNCLTCEINYIKKPGYPDSKNCVTECFYSYYYTSFGQYKCTNSSSCPDEANLYIKDLKKCTDDCKNEGKYKYQYGGQCLENCPKDTSPKKKNICIDNNNDNCAKSESEIDLQEFLTNGGVDLNAKNYAKEFGYTAKHISQYYNSIYSILIYKDVNCIEELSIKMPKVDFGDCYTKVQESLEPPTNDKLVIALVERSNGQKKSTTSYSFYHPQTGEKLDAETICKDEEIIIKASVLSQLNNSDVDMDSVLYLTQQNIDIFNLSDSFYTDICYHFDSPNGKDVPLQDRIKSYYPNITLCDSGCTSKGVNLTTMESICECKFNDIMNNELIEGNALIQSALGEVTDLLSSSNLLVLKCFEDVFKKEFILKGTGGFIVLSIMLFEIIFSFVFVLYDMPIILKYLYNLTEYFMLYNTNANMKNNNLIMPNQKVKAPPKKKLRKKSTNVNSFHNKYDDGIYSKSINTYKSDSKMLKNGLINQKSTAKLFKKRKNPLELSVRNDTENNAKLLKAKNNCGNIDMEEYLKPDLDDMEYDDAIKLDKRTFCEYFTQKLKSDQIIMDTFYNKENLIPLSIKIILLLLNIDLYFVINGFFYNEEYISELFNSDKEETFFSYLPRSISRFFYATMVSFVVQFIINCLFIEEKKIKRIYLREKDDPLQLRYEISLTVKGIKSRYTIFILICILLSIVSWYYISCFNNTYPGVRAEWIKSSITIIIIMQIISFLLVLLQAILRASSFHYKSEKLYKAKQFIS